MNQLFIFGFVLLFNAVKGDPKPNLIIIPRTQEVDVDQLPFNNIRPKSFVINGVEDQAVRDQPNNAMQAVMSAVQNQYRPNGRETNNSDIPDVIITDSDPQPEGLIQAMRSAPDISEKIYKFPAMTRMISSEEESENGNNKKVINTYKNNPILWRSPMPYMHDDCPHYKRSLKKMKALRKKVVRRQRKPQMAAKVEPTTTERPVPEDSDSNREPLRSLLLSIIAHSGPQPEPEAEQSRSEGNELRLPTSVLMAISHRTDSDVPELPFIPKPGPEIPLFMALMRKQLGTESTPEADLPLPPFLRFLSKMHKPIDGKPEAESNGKDSEEKAQRVTNYNFNVNLTVNNNNYPQPESKPYETSLPFPQFFPDLPNNLIRI